MAGRLFITNGDWTTRHEIGEAAIVIGRDPSCDLFFVNQKLSRRHARVEPGPDGVLLVDLGSRNGVWVNERKVGEHLLASGDSIRLGGLRMVYEEDDADATQAFGRFDSTLMVAGAARGAERTMSRKESDPESPDATVILSTPPLPGDRTVVPWDTEPDSEGAATVILASPGGSNSAELDASTRVLSLPDGTRRVADEDPILLPEPEPLVFRVKQRLVALPWQTKFSAALFGWSILLGGFLIWFVGVGSVVALIPLGLLCAGLVAFLATVLARGLLVEPVVRLRRDTEELHDGESLSPFREYRELNELVRSVNRLAGRTTGTDGDEG